MSWGIFSKLFRKRSSSQPPTGKARGKDKGRSKLASSLPALPEKQELDNGKSFGEFVKTVSMTSLDQLNDLKSSARPDNQNTLASFSGLETKKTIGDYESSDSEDKKSKTGSLDFLNTLTGTGLKRIGSSRRNSEILSLNKEDDTNSETSVSIYRTMSPRPTLADLIKEVQEKKRRDYDGSEPPVSRRESFKTPGRRDDSPNTDNQQQELAKENISLRKTIELLHKQILERESQEKKENDELIIKLFESLSREVKSEEDKQLLSKLLLSKQQEKNEKIINEQGRLIDTLNARCIRIENDLLNSNSKNGIFQETIQSQLKKFKDDNNKLREELAKNKKEQKKDLLKTNPDTLETTNKLKATYDEKLHERDEKIRQLKTKYDELGTKYRELIEENTNLKNKIDTLPSDMKIEMSQIRSQAQLVLEENKMLSQQYELQEKKLVEIQKTHIQESGRLSKRIIVCEAERVALLNEIDSLKAKYDEMVKKYNEYSIEAQRRVKLEDHLNQIGDLKRKIEELNFQHRQEAENLTLRLQAVESDKKSLIIKCTNLESDIKRIQAENKVLENALKKTQKKIQELQTQLEIAIQNEALAFKSLEKLTKQFNKSKTEKEFYEDLAKQTESELKQKEQKIAEQNLTISRLEDQLEEYKEKASTKLAKTMEKIKQKDADMLLIQMDKDKKLAQILKLLDRKQNQIEELTKVSQSDLDKFSFTNSLDNKRLKQILVDLKSQSQDIR